MWYLSTVISGHTPPLPGKIRGWCFWVWGQKPGHLGDKASIELPDEPFYWGLREECSAQNLDGTATHRIPGPDFLKSIGNDFTRQWCQWEQCLHPIWILLIRKMSLKFHSNFIVDKKSPGSVVLKIPQDLQVSHPESWVREILGSLQLFAFLSSPSKGLWSLSAASSLANV